MPINDPMVSNQKNESDQKITSIGVETMVEEANENQKSARRCAIGYSVVYSILFFPFFYMGLLTSMIFDNPRMTTPVGLSIIFLAFMIPLSMLISIYLMWSRYLFGRYEKIYLFCALPPLTFVGVSIIIWVLEALLRYFVPL